MTLTRLHKMGVAFFVCTLIPAYLIADWRHSANLASLDAAYAREQDLHESTDKLLSNCERNDTPYDANQQICNQGQRMHAQTSQAMELLSQEKIHNDSQWHRNFWLSVLLFNLLGWGLYKARVALSQE
jgi:hypothetical protein